MDDTKKLIEKYKRELMELSAKQKRSPKIIGYVDGDNDFLSGLRADIIEESAPEKNAASHGNSDAIPEGSDCAGPEGSRNDPEVVFERSDPVDNKGSDSGRTEIIDEYVPEPPRENRGTSEKNPPKCNSDDPEGFGGRDVVFEKPNSEKSVKTDGKITEIIDEYTPELPPKNSGNSENQTPRYTEISSTAQVREEITENSDPRDNVIESNVSGITDNSAAAPRADLAEAIRTTEEQAERLNDQPVSGTDPNEQLTGRSFEGAEPLPDVDISMEQGSRAEPIDYPEQNFSNFEEFEKVNTGRGSLMFRVYTGREAVVIEGAECVITKKIGSETRTIARLVTNESGQTPVQELPAPPKELSQNSGNTIQPFALYDAEVTKPGFVRVVLKDVPVFDGVQSVQRVFMIVE